MVEVNVAITFQIAKEDDAKKFVYSLGAHQFDELLFGAASEAIRDLVRGVEHTAIYGLRGTHCEQFNADIARALSPFGVTILNTTITEARLPPAIKAKRQETAQFASKIAEQGKRQENALLAITQQAEKDMNQLEREKEREVQMLLAQKNRALLNRREQIVQAEASKEVAIRKAAQTISTGLIKAQAQLVATKAQVETKRTTFVETAQFQANAQLVLAEQEAAEIILKSESLLSANTAKAQGIEAMAAAEEAAAIGLELKRAHDLELQRLRALAQVAKQRPLVVAGASADSLMGDMLAVTGI